jgi:hypothetical protein
MSRHPLYRISGVEAQKHNTPAATGTNVIPELLIPCQCCQPHPTRARRDAYTPLLTRAADVECADVRGLNLGYGRFVSNPGA